mgnify:CR=1 FL=1
MRNAHGNMKDSVMQTIRPVLLLVTMTAATVACSKGSSNGESAPRDSLPEAAAVVELPGVLLAPTGDTVSLGPDSAALIYYWLPLELYGEMEEDLLFLASLDSTVVPLPVQPDHEARNHAQRIVNGMEISLPVYLADSAVMSALDCSILPYSLLLLPGEEPLGENGFGSPRRLLQRLR